MSDDGWLDDNLDDDPELQAGTVDYSILKSWDDNSLGTFPTSVAAAASTGATPETTPQAAIGIDDIVPACPDCGRRPSEYAPNAEWHAEALELHARNPEATRYAQAFAFCCSKCLAERERIQREGDRAARIKALIAQTYQRGLLPGVARACRWERSNPDIEAKNPKAWQTARSFATANGNAWINGHPGTGKTFMARCIANEMLVNCHRVAELSAHSVRAWAILDLGTEMRRWVTPYLLIIDDLDKLHLSDWALGNLLQLLQRRMDAGGKRLVLTANTTGAMLAATWKRSVSPTLASTVTSIFERILPATGIVLSGGSNRERTK